MLAPIGHRRHISVLRQAALLLGHVASDGFGSRLDFSFGVDEQCQLVVGLELAMLRTVGCEPPEPIVRGHLVLVFTCRPVELDCIHGVITSQLAIGGPLQSDGLGYPAFVAARLGRIAVEERKSKSFVFGEDGPAAFVLGPLLGGELGALWLRSHR